MEELLRGKDIETRMLKKVSFGGYSVAEVDEFLDQISEDLELYVKRIDELERKIVQFEAEQKEYEDMKDSIQDTLFAAQRAAKQIGVEAQRAAAEKEAESDKLLSEARDECRRIVEEGDKVLRKSQLEREEILKYAELEVQDLRESVVELKHERMKFIELGEDLISEYAATLSRWRESADGA